MKKNNNKGHLKFINPKWFKVLPLYTHTHTLISSSHFPKLIICLNMLYVYFMIKNITCGNKPSTKIMKNNNKWGVRSEREKE